MSLKKYNSVYYFRMRFKVFIPALFVMGAVLAYQCSVGLQIPTQEDVHKSGTSLDTLIKGREMYIENCGSCHNLYLPEKYTQAQWNQNLDEMQKRAKISTEQTEFIRKYLAAKSKK